MNEKEIIEKCRSLKEENGISLRGIAEKAGVAKRTVDRLFGQGKIPGIDKLIKILEVFQAKIEIID